MAGMKRMPLGVTVTCVGLLALGATTARAAVVDSTFAMHFTAYSLAEPGLPDDRVYELVSPANKNGGDVGGEGDNGALASGLAESSASGSAVTYTSFASFGDAQSAELVTQYLSTRGPTGWSTQSLSPPAAPSATLDTTVASPYHLFTPELTAGVLDWTSPALAPGAPAEFDSLYVHTLESPTYQLVTTVAPPNRTPANYEVKFVGASADLSHVVFEANDALTPGAPANAQSVSAWTAGGLRLVSILPGPGEVAAASAGAGDGHDDIFANDVSADGSRIFWTDENGQLYVREDGAGTVQLNASQRAPSLGDGSAVFRAATPDGAQVFFTDETPLTNNPQDNGGLYVYDFAGGTLTDLTPDGAGSPGVKGVLGTSANGQSIYFVATAALAAGAVAGESNLYLAREDGALTFIAALSHEDGSDWTQQFDERTARVTSEGEYLAFMSDAPLTGYDNLDANTGTADTEVFVYDAGTGELSCASCNPSGARPVGSAWVPTAGSTGYLPRYISEDGQRVFFNSSDALLPAASNGLQNVYEYEHGNVYLISSGTSNDLSTFADASASGDDVFFTTRSQLVSEDKDESSDMYDARVGGGFPAPLASQAPYQGEGCRGPLSAPPPPLTIATEADGPAEDAPAPVVSHKPKASPHRSKVKRAGRKVKRRRRSVRKARVRR
jgi:Tol biopolymer transport system component